ncbi:MAG: molybdenum cofactor biosynthesis protein MoaE [Alphaproteobacteria bacterium]
MIKVQADDFDIGALIAALTNGNTDIGAIVSFVGTVRGGGGLASMTLEHYPGMTQTALERVEKTAHQRWPLTATAIIHRYGELAPGDNIMCVVVAAPHRQAAFEAAQFLMDYLKTDAPFWKLEKTASGERWVGAQAGDTIARARWEPPEEKK